MATLPAERTAKPIEVIRQSLTQMAPEFKAALPAHVSEEKFRRVAMTAIQNNPDLIDADRRSLFGAIVRLAQDGLLPDGREAALAIFNTKNKNGGWDKKVQAMPMIAGIMKKVRQSGEVASVDCHVVYERDEFVYRPGIDTVPVFKPDWFGDRGKPIGAYAIATLKSGDTVPPEIMSVADIERVRAVSRSKDKGPWADWWTEMARKTVMRRFSKRLPMSTDLDDMFDRDETMTDRNGFQPRVIDSEAVEPEPVSRLDALEHQIEDEAEDAEVEEVNDGTLADDNPTAEEGPDDSQRGETFV